MDDNTSLVINNGNALGSGSLTFVDTTDSGDHLGSLQVTGGGDVTLANDIDVQLDTRFVVDAGSLTLAGSVTAVQGASPTWRARFATWAPAPPRPAASLPE